MRVLLTIMALVFTMQVLAVETSPKGKITGYYTGWGSDNVRVTIDGASYSEGGCSSADGYMTLKSENNGYETHVSALLAAYMSGKEVRIVVEGCNSSNRPRIWGVYID